jgi:hypothetical protein
MLLYVTASQPDASALEAVLHVRKVRREIKVTQKLIH